MRPFRLRPAAYVVQPCAGGGVVRVELRNLLARGPRRRWRLDLGVHRVRDQWSIWEADMLDEEGKDREGISGLATHEQDEG